MNFLSPKSFVLSPFSVSFTISQQVCGAVMANGDTFKQVHILIFDAHSITKRTHFTGLIKMANCREPNTHSGDSSPFVPVLRGIIKFRTSWGVGRMQSHIQYSQDLSFCLGIELLDLQRQHHESQGVYSYFLLPGEASQLYVSKQRGRAKD